MVGLLVARPTSGCDLFFNFGACCLAVRTLTFRQLMGFSGIKPLKVMHFSQGFADFAAEFTLHAASPARRFLDPRT